MDFLTLAFVFIDISGSFVKKRIQAAFCYSTVDASPSGASLG